jgi:hypothetical protein
MGTEAEGHALKRMTTFITFASLRLTPLPRAADSAIPL